MSRAYRITLKESSVRELKGSDEICTQLEVLEVLPPEQMSELLRKELKEKGFAEQEDGTLSRTEGNVTVTINPKTCEVTVKADVKEEVTVESKKQGGGYDDVGPNPVDVRKMVEQQLKQDLDEKAKKESERLQGAATDELEKKLCDLQPELSEIVNKVTREALKQKAKQLGTIKELSEDEETGSLTIKIEV